MSAIQVIARAISASIFGVISAQDPDWGTATIVGRPNSVPRYPQNPVT